jgi:hypothetical protein
VVVLRSSERRQGFSLGILHCPLVRPVVRGPEANDGVADRDRYRSVDDESHDSQRPPLIVILVSHRAHSIAARYER